MSSLRVNSRQESPLGQPTTISRRKTGCWTCRIRRKRCDEIQDENGKCQECVRLNIPCAGWGEQRPEWAKDEENLRNFKESIKRQLMTRAPSRGVSAATTAVIPSSSGREAADAHGEHMLDDDYISSQEYNNGSRAESPEVFDYPGLATQLFDIARVCQLPHEYMVFVAQIAELGQWKAVQDANGILSYRELARRGQAIELSIFGQTTQASQASGYANYSYSPSAPVHSLAPQMGYVPNMQALHPAHGIAQSSQFVNMVSQAPPTQLIHMDACVSMLHCVVSGPNPRVPELTNATRTILSRFQSIHVAQRTVSLLFPLCIAGILGDNAESQLVQSQVNSLGAPIELVHSVTRLIAHVRQARWTHEISTANPLVT